MTIEPQNTTPTTQEADREWRKATTEEVAPEYWRYKQQKKEEAMTTPTEAYEQATMTQLHRIEYQLAYLSGQIQGAAIVVSLCAIGALVFYIGKKRS